MIVYITLGTADLEKQQHFTTPCSVLLALPALWKNRITLLRGLKMKTKPLSVTKPDQKPATVGNGVMVAMYFETPEQVNAFYDKAIEQRREGQPGFRPRYYLWFLRRLFQRFRRQ